MSTPRGLAFIPDGRFLASPLSARPGRAVGPAVAGGPAAQPGRPSAGWRSRRRRSRPTARCSRPRATTAAFACGACPTAVLQDELADGFTRRTACVQPRWRPARRGGPGRVAAGLDHGRPAPAGRARPPHRRPQRRRLRRRRPADQHRQRTARYRSGASTPTTPCGRSAICSIRPPSPRTGRPSDPTWATHPTARADGDAMPRVTVRGAGLPPVLLEPGESLAFGRAPTTSRSARRAGPFLVRAGRAW